VSPMVGAEDVVVVGAAHYERLVEVAKLARRLVDGMGMGTQGHLDRLEAALKALEQRWGREPL
jgi:hypothetical protein